MSKRNRLFDGGDEPPAPADAPQGDPPAPTGDVPPQGDPQGDAPPADPIAAGAPSEDAPSAPIAGPRDAGRDGAPARLDEAPSGGRYIVDGRAVDAFGKPIRDKD